MAAREQLYHSALARAEGERAAFLRAACAGDDALRHDVESLLAYASNGQGFMQAPAIAALAPALIQSDSMSKPLVGQRFGHYEIGSLLGSGGMGEVYRARDTKLNRDVALKVLPEFFAADPERLTRFRREAQLLASLNHPNIDAIHGFEESDGIQALVLELLEGPTLADRIAQSALPLDEVLPIARQIAEALEAAHEQGIVHRDLKPANIKVRPDGTVKVLDFGLAKLAQPSGSEAHAAAHTASPTITTPAMTGNGIILGTAAYMAPEQARGKAVDKRADIWAFGCVLYEMLTGRRAFEGEDVAETLGAVIHKEPSWTALPAGTPPYLRTLLRRCLQKDPKKRLPHIGVARIEIDEAPADAAEGPARVGHDVRWDGPRRVLPYAAAFVVMAAIAVPATWFLALWPAPVRVSRLIISPDAAHALTITGEGRSLAVSRDGTRVAYVGPNGALLVRSVDQLEPSVLAQEDGLVGPFFSPDGRWIGYFASNRGLRKVQVGGGPTTILGFIDSAQPGGATWGDDGTVVFATTNGATGLHVVQPGSTEFRVVTKPNRQAGESDHLWPEFLPGARAVLFTITALGGGSDSAQVAVLDLRTGSYHVVVPGGNHARYVNTGHLVYSAGGALRAVRFDVDRLETIGSSRPIGPSVLATSTGAADFDIAGDGTLVYVPAAVGPGLTTPRQRELLWMTRDGKEEPLGTPVRAYLYPRISPDGSRVLLDVRDQQNDIWLLDLRRGTLTNLTRNPALDRFPLWTPDGKQYMFESDRDEGRSAIYRQAADGSGDAVRLTEGTSGQQTPNALTADGKQLIFDFVDKSASSFDLNLMVVSLENARMTPLLQTPFFEGRAALSPDGRWLAYHANESGQFEIYVRPFPMVNTAKAQVSNGGGVQPWWSRTGKELFYFTPGGALMSVQVDSGPTWSVGRPTVVFENRSFLFNNTGAALPTFDVTPDGRRFLMIRVKSDSAQSAAARPLVVVLNWTEELKRLMAAN